MAAGTAALNQFSICWWSTTFACWVTGRPAYNTTKLGIPRTLKRVASIFLMVNC